jgi:hypothetical protein
MSGDRELLELAAKAMGYRCCHHLTDGGWYVRDDVRNVGLDWNPLSDDADALRLAVKVKVHPQPYDILCAAYVAGAAMDDIVEFYKKSPEDIGDPCAATRRAIVRAAAEIGKGMP